MEKARLYRFLRPLLTILMKIIFRPKIIGKNYIPKEGKVVLAGIHTSVLDPVLLLTSTKRTVHFLAKKELMDGPLGFGFKHMGIIPVNRGQKDKTVLVNAIKLLNKEKIIGVFPEGTTEKGRGLLPFKIGAVKMASETDSPIIPFAIVGKYTAFRSKVTIIFGKPYKIENKNDLDAENDCLKSKVINLMKEGAEYGKNK